MGGFAIKTVEVRKDLTAGEHARIVITHLVPMLPFALYSVPHRLSNKTVFGDIDIIVEMDTTMPGAKEEETIRRAFRAPEVVRHGHIISFALPVSFPEEAYHVQVDVIFCRNLELGVFMNSYGDLAALIGRSAAHRGWILRVQDGLTHRETGEVLARAPREICAYFSLDFDRWLRGFAAEEDAFDWILSSERMKHRSLYRKLIYEVRAGTYNPKKIRPFTVAFIRYAFLLK